MQQSIKTGKLVVGLLKKHWIILVGLFASIVLSSALSAITPMIFQKVIDGIATLDFQVLLLYVLAIVAIPFFGYAAGCWKNQAFLHAYQPCEQTPAQGSV